ncbi:putative dihydrodipicolinate synthase [Naematelia encephala]|uniref:Putative dihydrodipicolinate synthase n=1 Tax=Naematelia encephala TaxID=71784 RepID=A0A1Y2BMG7_9TREE|nr:putative dihydrodipicolinate synthase [Naematelia encephala]
MGLKPPRHTLHPGVYGPLPTFFDDNQEIDYISYKKHLLNLARRGIVPVCAGSLGEAVHLSEGERVDIIRFIRKTLDEAGLEGTPIVAGVGGNSTRETLRFAHAAARAGADAGMVILPAYYAASLGTAPEQIVQYYVDVCKESPIPILLYNFPANAGGLDMSSAVMQEIIERSPNLAGIKLTCPGSVGKLVRLKSVFEQNPDLDARRPFPFIILDGLIADLTPWMGAGGHGTVSGIPNFAPATTMWLWNHLNKLSPTENEKREARRIQAIMSNVDVAAVPGGIRAMKYALGKLHGFGIAPRRPLLPLGEKEGEAFMDILQPLVALEAEVIARET